MKKSIWIATGIAAVAAVALVGSQVYAKMDSDHDGVVNSQDECPDTVQLKKLPADFKYKAAVNPDRLKPGAQAWPVNEKGCEFDDDNDGIVDSQDYCREDTPEMTAKGVGANGCPVHTDQDGTPDYRDNCPDTPRGVPTDQYGCPKG